MPAFAFDEGFGFISEGIGVHGPDCAEKQEEESEGE
jgi:hypothetical protein